MGETIQVETLELRFALPEQPVVGERRAIALIVDLEDARASDAYTPNQIADSIWPEGSRGFEEECSVREVCQDIPVPPYRICFDVPECEDVPWTTRHNGLIQASSYDQVTVPADSDGDGLEDVFGPYSIPYSADTCNKHTWANAADASAVADGVDLDLYQHRIYILPRYDNPAYDCSSWWVMSAEIGCDGGFCRGWIREAENPRHMTRILGFNLGMGLSLADPDNDGKPNLDLVDLSDPLGHPSFSSRFNGPHVVEMGWFEAFPGSVIGVDAGGVIDLLPMSEHPDDQTAPRVLVVAKPDTGEHYFVSFRRSEGFDADLAPEFTQGVSIHTHRGRGSDTLLVQTLSDAAVFEDHANGVAIRQLSRASDGSSVTVEVELTPVPEPGGVSMLLAGTVMLVVVRRRGSTRKCGRTRVSAISTTARASCGCCLLA